MEDLRPEDVWLIKERSLGHRDPVGGVDDGDRDLMRGREEKEEVGKAGGVGVGLSIGVGGQDGLRDMNREKDSPVIEPGKKGWIAGEITPLLPRF